eukprot:66798_1
MTTLSRFLNRSDRRLLRMFPLWRLLQSHRNCTWNVRNHEIPKCWAKKGDCNIQNFPSESSNFIVHKCDIQYSKKQLLKIRAGRVPNSMDDKWFIFEDSNTQHMNLHRSWTGMPAYQCSIKNLKYNDKQQVILHICQIRQNKEYDLFFGYTPINYFILLFHWELDAGKPLNMTEEEWTRIQQPEYSMAFIIREELKVLDRYEWTIMNMMRSKIMQQSIYMQQDTGSDCDHCDIKEDTNHFLLHCVKYVEYRNQMMEEVEQILLENRQININDLSQDEVLNMLLFPLQNIENGFSNRLSKTELAEIMDTRIQIIKCVVGYVRNTNRFTLFEIENQDWLTLYPDT